MANWNLPEQESTYTQVLGEFKNRDEDTAKQFRNYDNNAILGSAWPTGTIRFDGAKWLTWSGASWEELSSSYGINVDRLGTYPASSTGGNNTIPVCNASKVQTNLNADLLDGRHAGSGQGNVPISNGSRCQTLNADMLDDLHAGNGSGYIPISNGNLCDNLNADLLDGYHISTDGGSGTIPVCNDSKVQTNLNADLLDGRHAGNGSGEVPISNGSLCVNLNADSLEGLSSGNVAGSIPISNGTMCINLNADLLDGKQGSEYSLVHSHPYLPLAGGIVSGSLTVTGGITESSDAALKYDILPIQGALDTISRLKGSTYKWKSDNKSSLGLIAQEVAKVVPDAVTYGEDGEAVGVQYTRLIALLIEAVKDLNNKLENK